jgi:uncharacterized protein YjbJ (UPF0337 family)
VDAVAKEQGYDTARREKAEFRKKGGKAVGDKDSTVEGHLSNIAGNTQDAFGGEAEEVRPKLEEAAKSKP